MDQESELYEAAFCFSVRIRILQWMMDHWSNLAELPGGFSIQCLLHLYYSPLLHRVGGLASSISFLRGHFYKHISEPLTACGSCLHRRLLLCSPWRSSSMWYCSKSRWRGRKENKRRRSFAYGCWFSPASFGMQMGSLVCCFGEQSQLIVSVLSTINHMAMLGCQMAPDSFVARMPFKERLKPPPPLIVFF